MHVRWWYGTTELGDGNPNSTWIHVGSQNQMFSDFRNVLRDPNGRILHNANYYTQWRCIDTSASSVGAAVSMADSEKNNGYEPLRNNCLTKSIFIVKAYFSGASNLGTGVATAPESFFHTKLNEVDSSPGQGTSIELCVPLR